MQKKMPQNIFMNQRKRNFKSIFVILALCAALGMVIYAMRYTRGDQFRQGMEVFFGTLNPPPEVPMSGRAWRWCPEKTERVEFFVSRASEDNVVPEQICEVIIEPVSEEKANRPMRRYLTVGSGSASKTLEADEALEVFRVEGLIFQSQSLSKTLRGH